MIIRIPYIIVSQKGTSSLILRGWMAEYISYTQALLAGQISIKDANYIHTYMGYGRGICNIYSSWYTVRAPL